MNTLVKYAGAATLAGALALVAMTPSQARDGRNAAAAIGFGAGAVVGAAAASSYYGAGYYNDYAYAPDYAYDATPAYYGDYAYAPGPRSRANYWAPSRGLRHGEGPGCIQSPASTEYTSCD